MTDDAFAVVIVTYNSAAYVGETLRALEPQLGEDDELIVVDNASSDATPAAVQAASSRARVLEESSNGGFAGGSHAGAAASTAPNLFFLNPDAQPAPGCLDELRRVGAERPNWGAWQALVTMDRGATINTSGNVTHFLGMGWSGCCGQPVAAAPTRPVEVGFASGAALVVRRAAWERLGGFHDHYFMYGEDLDLGLRLWLASWSVGIAPRARVEHDYEFAKGGQKWFLLERNRWWTVIGDYPGALLALLLPSLLAAEFALLAVAARGGWLRHKLRAQAAVVRELPQMIARRREVQANRQVSARAFAARLSAELDSPYLGGAARLPPFVSAQQAYWRLVLSVLR